MLLLYDDDDDDDDDDELLLTAVELGRRSADRSHREGLKPEPFISKQPVLLLFAFIDKDLNHVQLILLNLFFFFSRCYCCWLSSSSSLLS